MPAAICMSCKIAPASCSSWSSMSTSVGSESDESAFFGRSSCKSLSLTHPMCLTGFRELFLGLSTSSDERRAISANLINAPPLSCRKQVESVSIVLSKSNMDLSSFSKTAHVNRDKVQAQQLVCISSSYQSSWKVCCISIASLRRIILITIDGERAHTRNLHSSTRHGSIAGKFPSLAWKKKFFTLSSACACCGEARMAAASSLSLIALWRFVSGPSCTKYSPSEMILLWRTWVPLLCPVTI